MKKCEVLKCTTGPIARSVDDLLLVLRYAFANTWKHDPLCSKAVFDEEMYQETLNKKKLKIAYLK